MGELKKITVDSWNVSLQNEGALNTVTVHVDLEGIWNVIIQYTHITIQVALMIPVIKQGLLENVKLKLEETYDVKKIGGINKSVILVGKFPGIFNPSGQGASGEALVAFFDII